MNRTLRTFYLLSAAAWGWLVEAGPAAACSVCFGDPDSPMSRGVVMGVVVLVGIIGFVLLGVAGTIAFWMHRSRRLAGLPPSDLSTE